MKKEIIEVIENRISKIDFKPNDIKTGMSGSFLRFKMCLGLYEFFNDDDFETYDSYLYSRHGQIYAQVNGIDESEVSFNHKDYNISIVDEVTHIGKK